MPAPLDTNPFRRQRILVVGDLMLDRYLWGDVRRISPEAPVQVLHVRTRSEVCGGAGNVVANLVGLGGNVVVLGVCGCDPAGQRVKALLGAPGVECAVVDDRARPTVTKTRVLAKSQQLLRIDEEEISPLDDNLRKAVLTAFSAALPKCDLIILSDYGKGLLQSPGLAQQMITLAREHQRPVLVDPKGKDWTRYRGATSITPNTRELELACGRVLGETSQLRQGMQKTIRDCELDWLLVTQGPKGMSLLAPQESPEPIIIHSSAREVYDVSGAGDTVIATLGACLAAGIALHDAAALANLAAGIVVGKVGTQPVLFSELQSASEPAGNAAMGRFATKVVTAETARSTVQQWKTAGETIVFTNGCFDLLHPGHVHLLSHARACGSRLVVGLNSDASVSRLKSDGHPLVKELDRASLVAALDVVDLVVVFDGDTPEPLLRMLQPDLLVKGSNYAEHEVVGREIVEQYGGSVRILPTLKEYSSERIANRIEQRRIY